MKLKFSSVTAALLALAVPLAALPMQSLETAHEVEVPEGLAAGDWSNIRTAYEAHRHAAFKTDDGFEARNHKQDWRTRFDGRGATTVPNDGDWTWGLELVEWGYAGQTVTVDQPRAIRAEARRVSHDWDDALTEWWVNDGRGLEHGFTVHASPGAVDRDTDDILVFDLKVLGGLQPEVTESRRGARFLGEDGATVLTYNGLLAFDAKGTDLDTWMERTGEGLRLVVRTEDAHYPITVDPLVQAAYLKASNPGNVDIFGGSVAISGDTVVVGATGEDSGATGVNPGAAAEADNSSTASGAAYVFVRSGSTWSQEAYLKASNTGGIDSFGVSVAISGDTIVVGAGGEDSSATGVNAGAAAEADNSVTESGAAYVFVRSGSVWSQEAYLKASNTDPADNFGWRVAISGNTIAVGAPFEDSSATGANGGAAAEADNGASNSGAVHVFVRTGSDWSQEAYLKASNTGGSDWFGWSLASSGDTIVVGAAREASRARGVNGGASSEADNSAAQAGAAYVFVRSGSVWSQEAYLKASNTGPADRFGQSVATSGNTIVVGAIGEASNATGINPGAAAEANNNAQLSGAAYVFVRSGSVWSQEAYLKASNTGAADFFGLSVAISEGEDTVVVGARGESSNATGVNAGPAAEANNSTLSAGAAYMFMRSGSTWSQDAYLKSSNPGTEDWLGASVAVSGNTVLVGASTEDGAEDSEGAVFIFEGSILGNPICSPAVPNSTGVPGKITATGSDVVLDNDVTLFATDLPASVFGLFLTSPGQGMVVMPNGSAGTLCINSPTIGRYGVVLADASGAASLAVDLTSVPELGSTTAVVAGDTRYWQFWYRDSGTSNFTDAVEITFQ